MSADETRPGEEESAQARKPGPPEEPEAGDDPGRSEESEEEREPGRLAQAREAVADQARPLQDGSQVAVGGPLPVRAVVAVGVFVGVFMVVWLALWYALGGLGLGLGWIVAALAGAAAVKLLSDRLRRRG